MAPLLILVGCVLVYLAVVTKEPALLLPLLFAGIGVGLHYLAG